MWAPCFKWSATVIDLHWISFYHLNSLLQKRYHRFFDVIPGRLLSRTLETCCFVHVWFIYALWTCCCSPTLVFFFFFSRDSDTWRYSLNSFSAHIQHLETVKIDFSQSASIITSYRYKIMETLILQRRNFAQSQICWPVGTWSRRKIGWISLKCEQKHFKSYGVERGWKQIHINQLWKIHPSFKLLAFPLTVHLYIIEKHF